MDTNCNCKNRCKNKRVYASRGEWTLIRITKKRCKNKWVDALRGLWILIGIAKKCKNKSVEALRPRLILIGITKESAKVRRLIQAGACGH